MNTEYRRGVQNEVDRCPKWFGCSAGRGSEHLPQSESATTENASAQVVSKMSRMRGTIESGKWKMKSIKFNDYLRSPGCWTCFDWFRFKRCPK